MEFVAGMVSWVWSSKENNTNFEPEDNTMNAILERDEDDQLEAQDETQGEAQGEAQEYDAYEELERLLEELSKDPYEGNSEDIV